MVTTKKVINFTKLHAMIVVRRSRWIVAMEPGTVRGWRAHRVVAVILPTATSAMANTVPTNRKVINADELESM